MGISVDALIARSERWHVELSLLRNILLQTGLKEEVKWGQPCYTLEGRNVIVIHGFKEYCALLFFKGALLKDPEKLLIQQTENVQSSRQIRFTQAKDIVRLTPTLKRYVFEAIEVEKAGLKVIPKKVSEYKVPAELTDTFKTSPALKEAFHKLTPGRQRAYLLFFGSAKLPQTRISRIEKNIPRILQGKGLNDL